jgi:hypothetical protein
MSDREMELIHKRLNNHGNMLELIHKTCEDLLKMNQAMAKQIDMQKEEIDDMRV